MQTSAPLVAPQLHLYSALPSSIVIQWSRSLSIGDATVDAYEIKVNGEIVDVLDSNDLSYEWTNCSPCKEYKFRIKALSSKDDCHSDWSQALPVVCPGACQPVISRAPSNHVNNIHVTWDTPSLYGGATVEHYKVHYLAKEEDIPLESLLGNPDTITHGPLKAITHMDTLRDTHPSLPYSVVLEASLLPIGCHRVFSQPIRTRVAVAPEPPSVDVKVIWLKERTTLERFASRLAQLKDRISRKVQILQNTVVVKGSKQKEIQIAKNNATLRNLDIELTNCVQFIKTHTGTLNVEVIWSVPRDDGDATITGYQVFINNQKHGEPLNMNTLKVDLKLPASPHDHVITLRSLTNHPIGHSEPSSEIPLPTKAFLPFVQFCYFGVHSESHDCCYEDSLSYELKNKQVAMHRGTLGKPLPSPVCYVTDVFKSRTRHLVEPTDKPLVILFWTIWCHSSLKAMAMFVEFSRNHHEHMNFITCCVQSNQPASGHHHCLREQLTSRDWISKNVQHLCGCHPAGQQPFIRRNEGGSGRGSVCHVYGLVGVPTIVLCNHDGYITWQGRICAHNFAEYEKCLLHAFNESLNQECSISECDQCVLDYELDTSSFTSQMLSNPHDSYDYKKAKQDSSLVVTGHLSRFHHDYHSTENFQKIDVTPSDLTETIHPGTLKNTEVLRRRLHNTRPQTSPSKEISLTLPEANARPLTRAKTANQTRNSIFKSRFSSSMTSSLPSLGLTNRSSESGKQRSVLTKPKKVTISVDEFNPV